MSDPDPTVPPATIGKKAPKRGGRGKQAKAASGAAPADGQRATVPSPADAAPAPASRPVSTTEARPATAPANGLTHTVVAQAASSVSNDTLSLDDASPHAALEDNFFRQGIEAERPGTAGHVLFEALDRDHRRKQPLVSLLLERLPALVSLPPVKKREAALMAGGVGALAMMGLGLWLIFTGDASASNSTAAKSAPAPATIVVDPAVAPVVATPIVAAAPAAEPRIAAAQAVAAGPADVVAEKGAPAARVPEAAARPAITAAALGGAVGGNPLSPEFDAQIARCREANGKSKFAVVVESCGLALAAKPEDPEAALMIAHAEFERGRSAQALTWAKKVITVDPSQADAYVFMGGAEQAAGRPKAAREAYRKYLELAPKGRYASDLRVILQTL